MLFGPPPDAACVGELAMALQRWAALFFRSSVVLKALHAMVLKLQRRTLRSAVACLNEAQCELSMQVERCIGVPTPHYKNKVQDGVIV